MLELYFDIGLSFQVKTSIYFELHSAVQGALGISHALDVDGSKLREIMFIFVEVGGAIFREILQFGMTHESKHIRQASEEILLYFLKAEKIMVCISLKLSYCFPKILTQVDRSR